MRFVIFILLSLFINSGFAAENTNSQIVVTGNTTFAFDLYGKLRTTKGNLFFSPYSISTALAMTYAGARGQTEAQMAQVLHFDLPQEKLHPAFTQLTAGLKAIEKKGKVQLQIANSLWPQKGYAFLPEYLGLLKKCYDSSVTPLNFGDHEASRKVINEWVESKTNRKITDLIQPGVLNGSLLVLVNAIYFKGDWMAQFDSKLTTDQIFHVAAGKDDATCRMMSRLGKFGYAESPDWQMLELPYAGDDLAMVVMLPRHVEGIGALEKSLSADNLAGWIKELTPREVQVQLPKFKLTCQFEMADTLQQLGMVDAFSKANFSGMDGQERLFISRVIHKAFVDVNEEGTEAAAATAVIMKRSMAGLAFCADHPFVFLIRDKHTGSILFLGRVMSPAG